MQRLVAIVLSLTAFLLVAARPTDVAAQAVRTWVSGVGDDANTCSRTAPCKTFAGAISKTAAGGIIDVLDPGGYGTITITKSITIRGVGSTASILASSTTGVTINAASTDTVNLVNLQIDGAVTGLLGVRILQAAQVTIDHCKIFDFRSGAGTAIFIGTGMPSRTSVLDTVIANNLVGLDVAPSGAVGNGVAVDNTIFDHNTTANIRENSATAGVTINRSFALGGPIVLTNGAVLKSFGNNAIVGGAPNSSAPLQ